jgi:hypothetical protein
VTCAFCHQVESFLEHRATQYAHWNNVLGMADYVFTPLSRYHYMQLTALGKVAVDFETDFEEKSAGYDWEQRWRDISANQTRGHAVGGKRKRRKLGD